MRSAPRGLRLAGVRVALVARAPELLVVRARLRAASAGGGERDGVGRRACLRAAWRWIVQGAGDGQAPADLRRAFCAAYSEGHLGGPLDRLRALAHCEEDLA